MVAILMLVHIQMVLQVVLVVEVLVVQQLLALEEQRQADKDLLVVMVQQTLQHIEILVVAVELEL
jgi:hypothetical protein